MELLVSPVRLTTRPLCAVMVSVRSALGLSPHSNKWRLEWLQLLAAHTPAASRQLCKNSIATNVELGGLL